MLLNGIVAFIFSVEITFFFLRFLIIGTRSDQACWHIHSKDVLLKSLSFIKKFISLSFFKNSVAFSLSPLLQISTNIIPFFSDLFNCIFLGFNFFILLGIDFFSFNIYLIFSNKSLQACWHIHSKDVLLKSLSFIKKFISLSFFKNSVAFSLSPLLQISTNIIPFFSDLFNCIFLGFNFFILLGIDFFSFNIYLIFSNKSLQACLQIHSIDVSLK